MWLKQYDLARWNGIEFHILQTDKQSGKRVQVSEIPYEDNPYTKVMGSIAKKLNITAVFVGVNSLSEAQVFEQELDQNPIGVLEHPEYGELELIFVGLSQSISTKRGLVNLKLDFIANGKTVSVLPVETQEIKTLTAPVIDTSIKEFEKQVESADVNEVTGIQSEMSGRLESLNNLVGQINQTAGDLKQLKRDLNGAMDSVSGIKNDPKGFAESFSGVVNSVSTMAIANDDSGLGAVGTRQYSLMQYRKALRESNSHFVKNNMLMGTLEMSKPYTQVNDSGNDVLGLLNSGFSIDGAEHEFAVLKSDIAGQIDVTTQTASFENMQQADSLMAVQADLTKKTAALNHARANIQVVPVFRPTNVLRLAKRYQTTPESLMALNNITNPMFVVGDIKVIPWLS